MGYTMILRVCSLVILSISILGCSNSLGIIRDDKGVITDLKVKGILKASIKTKDETITVDSKNEPVFKDIISLDFSAIKDGK